MPGAGMHVGQNALESLYFRFRQLPGVMRHVRVVTAIFAQFGGQLSGREDHVGQAGAQGGARHAVIFGIFRLLDHDQAAHLLDILDAHRAVGPTA